MSFVGTPGAKTRWLVALLVCFVSLGHACELPVAAVVASHVHETGHDDSHEHSGDAGGVVCDAVAGIQPSPSGISGVDHARAAAAVAAVPGRMVGGPAVALAPAEPPDGSRRPPLFLLYRSLLI